MLKQLVECVLNLLNLARDRRANKEAIAELRREVDELASAVERLPFELRSTRDEDRHEHEKPFLRMENVLLKMGRQLPPAKKPKELVFTRTRLSALLRHSQNAPCEHRGNNS